MAVAFTNQWTGGSTSAGSSVFVTVGNAGGTGTLMVALIGVFDTSGTQRITAITDDASNTWHYIGTGSFGSGHTNTEMWVTYSPAAATTLTLTNGLTSVPISVNVSEYSGLVSGTSLDVSATGSTASANPVSGGSVTTATASDLVVGGIGYGTAAGVVYSVDGAASTPTSGWTGLTKSTESTMNVSPAYNLNVGSAGSVVIEWSQSPTGSQQIGWVVASFKANTGTIANAGVAGVTCAAYSPGVAINPTPSVATVTATGYNPSGTTGSNTTAAAGVASVTVSALSPTPKGQITAGLASATVAAPTPTPKAQPVLGVAQVSVTAYTPVPNVGPVAGRGNVGISAFGATGSAGSVTTAVAGIARVTVASLGPSLSVAPAVPAAQVVVTANGTASLPDSDAGVVNEYSDSATASPAANYAVSQVGS